MRGLSDDFGRPSAPRSSAARRWSGYAGRTASSAPAAAIEHCVGGSGSLSQPVQEAGIAHGGHDLPRDQAAADTLVRCQDGEERHLVGGTSNSAEAWAVKHKIMAVMDAARGGDVAGRVEMDDAYVEARPRRGGQNGSVAAVSTSRGAPAQAEAGGRSRASASARSRAAPNSGWPPERCDGRPGLLERTTACNQLRTGFCSNG